MMNWQSFYCSVVNYLKGRSEAEGDQYILYFSDAFYIFLCYPEFANAANKLGKN